VGVWECGSGRGGEGEGVVSGAPSVFGKSGSWKVLVREEAKCKCEVLLLS
jgi:hypothetical protein